MAQSKFITEIRNEIKVRLTNYKRERKELENASKRIQELDGMISEAESELAEYPEEQAEEASKSEE